MKIVVHSFFLLSLSSVGLVEAIAAATNVYAKNGSEAVLLCEWADDSVKWYGIGDHQYSTGKNIMQSLPNSLRQRLHIIDDTGFNLGIRDIHKDDEGKYKCISDNGTTNYNVYLIVAPTSITFPSSSDGIVITTDANKMFNAICEADGGFPPPVLSLMWNETFLTSLETTTLAYAINVTRTDDFTNVTCTANHSELNHPLEIHAMFYLNLSPTHLRMMELPTMFEEKLVNISCISIGSRPQASSEWTIDGDVISNSSEDQSEIINPTETYMITSILSFKFNRLQNRKELSCRSFNLADTNGISQSRMIEVYYHPSIDIIYKNTTEDEELRKFTCKPNGNPAVYDYDEWEHLSMYNESIRHLKGRKTGTGAGEIILPVSKLNERYQDSGIYRCRAQNDILDRYGNKMQMGFVSFISEELENGRDGEWQTAGIVLITIIGLIIVLPVALCIYKKKKYNYEFSGNRSLRPIDNVELNHQQHDDSIKSFKDVQDFTKIAPAPLTDERYIGDSIESFKDVQDFTNRAPASLPDERHIDETSKTENHSNDLQYMYTAPYAPAEKSLMNTTHAILSDKKLFEVTVSDPTFVIVDVPAESRKVPVKRKSLPPSPPPSQRPSQLQSSTIEDKIRLEILHTEPRPIPRPQKPLPSSPPPSPSMEETTSIEAEYSQPTKMNVLNRVLDPFVTEKESMDTADSIINHPKCLPTVTDRISSEQKQTINHSKATSRPSPPSSPVEDEDLSSGFASFHGPDSMDQRPSIPRSIQHLSQDRLDEEDESSWGDSSNSNPDQKDEVIAIDNPSYQRKFKISSIYKHQMKTASKKEGTLSSIHSSSNEVENDDDIYHDAQSKPCEVSSVSSDDVCLQETTSTEEVHPQTTNTDKKKLLQYYPTFPKLNNSDDDTWTKPAEPIKVLDASQEETQPMELNPSLNDHNDEDKTDSTSEDKGPETQN